MTKHNVVGIALRDSWDYDFIKPWMDREKQVDSVRETLETLADIKEYELPRKIKHLWCNPEDILAATEIPGNKYLPAIRIKYNKSTLSYLLNKPPEILEKLTKAVVSGIQKGLEETIRKQEEYRQGADHRDEGFLYLTEMEKKVAEALNNNKEIYSTFSLEERNHMVYHFVNMFIYKMENLGLRR